MRKFFIVLFATTLYSVGLFSQVVDRSNPLESDEMLPPSEFGILFGFGLNLQSGQSLASCQDCIFEDGNKFGYTIGLAFEDNINSLNMKLGGMLVYDDLSVYSSFKEREPFEFQPIKYVPINFRHHSTMTIQQVSLIPYFKWSPASIFFIKAGPNIGYLLNANLLHEKEVLDDKTLLPTGETVSIEFPETKSKKITLEDEEYKDLNKFQFGISLMTGFNFELGYDLVLAPYFMYNIPFTNISNYGESYKVSNWRILIELRTKI